MGQTKLSISIRFSSVLRETAPAASSRTLALPVVRRPGVEGVIVFAQGEEFGNGQAVLALEFLDHLVASGLFG